MRLAFLHFDLCGGPLEKNRDNLLQGIGAAAAQGADWVLTPEMALQGYHMATGGRTPFLMALRSSVSNSWIVRASSNPTSPGCSRPYDRDRKSVV